MDKCYWCGKQVVSKDHVPPKSFFNGVTKYNPIVNPSCSKHNEDFSKIDFRSLIYIVGATFSNKGEDYFENKISKSLDREKSKGLKKALQNEMIYDKQGKAILRKHRWKCSDRKSVV